MVREIPLSPLQRVVTVDGLIPCSMYRFRIIISSNSGSPAYSQTVESETGVEGLFLSSFLPPTQNTLM